MSYQVLHVCLEVRRLPTPPLLLCERLSCCSDPLHGEGLWGQEAWPEPQVTSWHQGIILQGLLCGLSPPLSQAVLFN